MEGHPAARRTRKLGRPDFVGRGGVTVYLILAITPGVALISIYGLFADPASIASHLDTIANVAPGGGGVEVLHDALTRLALRGSTTLGIGFLVSLVISLWLTSSGVSALFDALNIVCEEEELGRVVKAGGPVRLLEYVRPQQTVRRALARLWEPWIAWTYGASFDRRTEEHIPEAGLELAEACFVVDDLVRLISARVAS